MSKSVAALFMVVLVQVPNVQAVEDFALKDFRGKRVALADYADQELVVVAFLGTECPLAKLYGPRLAALTETFSADKVAIVGVFSNSQDAIAEIAAYARRHEISFPLLKDPANRVADQFKAERTPEVFLLDAARNIRYQGRIDDQYGVGYSRDRQTRDDLKIAIEELLDDQAVSVAKTKAVGCHIGRVTEPDSNSNVTYSNQIARIFQKHCVECHRAGEIAPFELTDFEEASGWAETIAEVIHDQRMPPWNASSEHGDFSNERRMTQEEKELVYRWAEAGAPEGEPGDLPPPREFVTGWRLPKEPDMVIAMRSRPYRVPAEGTVPYQYFVVDPKFEEDKYVWAAQVAPGNNRVVHHAIVFIRPPDGARMRGFGWLSAYVPGQSTLVLEPSQARRVPAGSKLVFQMHYTPVGSPQEDTTKVGILFAEPSTIREEVITLMAANRKFEIPPHASNYLVDTSSRRFPKDGRLLAIAPHMHVRGKAFRVVAHSSAGSRVLLDVPQYDFNWQHAYRLASDLPLADIDRIECIARFDNSENNLANPDPKKTVRWGDQTWEEMMIGFFELAVPADTTDDSQSVDRLSDKQQEEASRAARRFIEQRDKNGDGKISRDEIPQSFRIFAFKQFDDNGDAAIDAQEAERHAAEVIRRRERRRSALEEEQ